MKDFWWVALVVGAGVVGTLDGCASVGASRAGTLSAERGAVVVPGTSVKAIVFGPKVIHAFASDNGAALYTVAASDHSDRDCAAAVRSDPRRAIAMARDQRVVFTVPAGEVACLATSGRHDFELLWHATGETVPAASDARVAMAGRLR